MSRLWFSFLLAQAVIASLYKGWTYYKPTGTGEKYEALGNARIFKSFNLLDSYLGNDPDLEVAFFHDNTLNDAKNLGRVTMIEFKIGFTFISRPKLFDEAEKLFVTLKSSGSLQDFIGFSMYPNNPDSIIFFFSRPNWIDIGRNFSAFALKLVQKRESAYTGIIEKGNNKESSWSVFIEDTGKRENRPEPLFIGNGLKSLGLSVELMTEAMLNSKEKLKCSIQQVTFFPREELDLIKIGIPFGYIDKILLDCLEKVCESVLAPEHGYGLENVVMITAEVIDAASIDLCLYLRAKTMTGKFNIVDQALIASAFDHFKYSYILDAHFAEDLNPFAPVGLPYELSYTIGDDDSTEKIIGFNPMFQDPREFDMSCVVPSALLWTSTTYTLWITPQMGHVTAGAYSYRLTLTNVINFRVFLQTFWHEFLLNPKYMQMVSTFAFISIRSENTSGREVEILLDQVQSFVQDDPASTRIFLWALFSYLGFELKEVPSATPTRFKDLAINSKPSPLVLDGFDQGFNFKWNIAERNEALPELISINPPSLVQSYPKPMPICYAEAAGKPTKSCLDSADIMTFEGKMFESDDEVNPEAIGPHIMADGMTLKLVDHLKEVRCETIDKRPTEAESLHSSSSHKKDAQVETVEVEEVLPSAAPQELVPTERTKRWGPRAERFNFLVSRFDDAPVDLSCTHPLQHSWNLFFIDPEYETRQLNTLPISTVEFFWQIMNNLAELHHGYSYAFWKGDGQPKWESPENAGGSRLTNQIKGSNGIGYWAMFLVWLLANQEDKLIDKISGFIIKRVSGGIYPLTLWYRKGFSLADASNFELIMNEIKEDYKINMNDKWKRKDFENSA